VDWIQLWYLNREPEGDENLLFEKVDAVIVGYPKTLDVWVRGLQARGIKVLPYISFYKAPRVARVPESMGWEGGSPAKSECLINPFWKAVATDDHPEWIGRDENGNARRPFENEKYLQGWDQTCPLAASYREACIRGLQELMEDGYDGIFLDNVHISDRLPHVGQGSGEEVGNAATSLVIEAARLVHAMDPELLFAANGEIVSDIEPVVDLITLESFFFSCAWDLSIFLPEICKPGLENWQAHFEKTLARYSSQPWRPGVGAQPVAIVYLGFSGRSLREDAFTFLAIARILGMAACDAGSALNSGTWKHFQSRDVFFRARSETAKWVRDFYRLDLGEPRSDVLHQENCLIRYFDRGACVFNPTDKVVRVSLEGWSGNGYEIACDVDIAINDGIIPVWLPPFCGRIVLAS